MMRGPSDDDDLLARLEDAYREASEGATPPPTIVVRGQVWFLTETIRGPRYINSAGKELTSLR